MNEVYKKILGDPISPDFKKYKSDLDVPIWKQLTNSPIITSDIYKLMSDDDSWSCVNNKFNPTIFPTTINSLKKICAQHFIDINDKCDPPKPGQPPVCGIKDGSPCKINEMCPGQIKCPLSKGDPVNGCCPK
jgi:hypothetical protein